MAGVGIRLNQLCEKRPAAMGLTETGYCCSLPAVPVLAAGGALLLGRLTGLGEPFFRILCGSVVFALLAVAPLSAAMSKFLQDALYAGRMQDIRPAYRVGLALLALMCGLLGIPFCRWASFAGGALASCLPIGLCCGLCLSLALYALLYLLSFREYGKAALFFLAGLLAAFPLAPLLHFAAGQDAGWSILLALSLGFALTAALGYASVRRHLTAGGRLWPVARGLLRHWPLLFSHFFAILGLCLPYFPFLAAGLPGEAGKGLPWPACGALSYVAMLTSVPALLFFAVRADGRFYDRYRAYSQALFDGSLPDIRHAKEALSRARSRLCREMAIAQGVLFACSCLLLLALGPRLGLSAAALRAYPCLAAACFVLMQAYAGMLFLYYFNDLGGALLAACAFCLCPLSGVLLASRLGGGYALGLLTGALAGWLGGRLRLGWAVRHMQARFLCRGRLLERGKGARPPDQVFVRPAAAILPGIGGDHRDV